MFQLLLDKKRIKAQRNMIRVKRRRFSTCMKDEEFLYPVLMCRYTRAHDA